MERSDKSFIKYNIHMAKQALIKARIHRQKATIAKEFNMYFTTTPTLAEEAQVLLDEAKALRNEARVILIAVERANGERYLADKPVFPLMHYLKGSFFKAWKEFDVEYAKIGAPFFGSDPE